MIHISREPEYRNVRETFFPVSLRQATCRGNRGDGRPLPGYYALYDDERDYPITVVSRHYKLITNEKAYQMAEALAMGVFGRHIEEFPATKTVAVAWVFFVALIKRRTCNPEFIRPMRMLHRLF